MRGNKFSMKKNLLIAALLLISNIAISQDKNIAYYRDKAPFPLPEVKAPVFQDKDFLLTAYGAIGDGQSLCTEAFEKAITACNQAGGGRVVVPAGLWLTGPIKLQSNVNLHVERGGVIMFSKDFSLYPMAPLGNGSNSIICTPPISGYKLKNIAITGEGIIDGNGEAWRPVKKMKTTEDQWNKLLKSGGVLSNDKKIWWPTQEALDGEKYLKDLKKNKAEPASEDYIPARVFLRPNLVHLSNCENLLVEGITLRNAPKFVFYPTGCSNVIVRHATIFNEWWAQNGDGIDISACRNVVIYRCNVSVGDDGICMKSSGGNRQDRSKFNLQNVLVAECTVYHGHGGFVIGSNTDGGMENIYVSNCSFIGTDIGVRVKSNAGRGGLVHNIHIENIYMKDIIGEAVLFDTYYDDVPAGTDAKAVKNTKTDKAPEFTRFYFRNIYCAGAETGIFMRGLPGQPVHDIYFEDAVFAVKKDKALQNAENIILDKNVRFITE